MSLQLAPHCLPAFRPSRFSWGTLPPFPAYRPPCPSSHASVSGFAFLLPKCFITEPFCQAPPRPPDRSRLFPALAGLLFHPGFPKLHQTSLLSFGLAPSVLTVLSHLTPCFYGIQPVSPFPGLSACFSLALRCFLPAVFSISAARSARLPCFRSSRFSLRLRSRSAVYPSARAAFELGPFLLPMDFPPPSGTFPSHFRVARSSSTLSARVAHGHGLLPGCFGLPRPRG